MHIKNYHEANEAIQPYLSQYLEEQGINTENLFSCINPDHEDKNPSMGIAPSGKVCHCFSCGMDANIFHAAHFLEKKPTLGMEFVYDNLIYLANKFDVEVEFEPFTEEEIYKYDTYRAYADAAKFVINNRTSETFEKAIAERGWSNELCKELGIGCVPDYKEFREHLKKLGYNASFLNDIDLDRKSIFGEDRLIFTIRDAKGKPVGFASRNLSFTEDKTHGSKFVNQKGTGLKCNIYKKSTRLFGLDRVLARRESTVEPVYLFEGYADTSTAAQHGMWNTVAIGSAALSSEQLYLLKQHGFYHVILCFDGDEIGKQRAADMLDTVLSNQKDLKVSIVIIPDGADPDKYIREQGVNQFQKLKKWSAFEWRLSQFPEEATAEDICAAMIPLIVNETSYISQETLSEILSKSTGITLKTITQELERLQNQKSREVARDRDNIIQQMTQSINKNPEDAEFIIREAENRLFDLAKQHDNDAFSADTCIAQLRHQKSLEEAKDGSFSGFKLGPDLATLEKALNGQWKQDVWMCIGGKANAGKTSMLIKLSHAIASLTEENNATVIYHSIDDTLEQIMPKFVAVAEGTRSISLNEITDPNYHVRDQPDKPIIEKRNTGYSIIEELMRDERIVLKDSNHGISIAFADHLIHYYKSRHPDRNIIYILDNFHKLSDFQSAKGDERVRFKEISKEIKRLATKHHICVMSTVEYRKTQNAKASNDDILETGQIEYDANLIAHLHNDVHSSRNKTKLSHTAVFNGEPTDPLPTIELEIGKNKITGFKKSLYFDFFPYCSDFVYISEQEAVHRQGKEHKDGKEDNESALF